MLNVKIDGMRMRVAARYRSTGSVLDDTVEATMLGAATTLEIESAESPERVARVVRSAERGCFVVQALSKPVAVSTRTVLNGAALEVGSA